MQGRRVYVRGCGVRHGASGCQVEQRGWDEVHDEGTSPVYGAKPIVKEPASFPGSGPKSMKPKQCPLNRGVFDIQCDVLSLHVALD